MTTRQEKYWTERYLALETGWDMGQVSPPLATYVDQLENKSLKILIPGAGNGWEAEYLWDRGFTNVHVLDISRAPLDNFSKRVPGFPVANMIQTDFFQYSGEYDLILEQTFFCAIEPRLRMDYVKKVYDLLVPGGKLSGLLFCVPLNDTQPPYGGSESEYRPLFETCFNEISMEPCYNSIEPRMGTELFIRLRK